jgi:hypothetical protein
MSMTGPLGIHPFFAHRAMGADDRDDSVIRPDPLGEYREGIEQAIQQRESAILAEAQAQRDATAQARKATLSRIRAAAAERKVFDQVAAVGGFRNAS